MLVPIIIAGIVTGAFAALMSVASGTGLLLASYIYVVAGGLAALFSAILYSLQFVVKKVWWSLNIDFRVHIIIAHIASVSVLLSVWAIIIGINGNIYGSLVALVVGFIGIPVWLSYSFDNFVAKQEERYVKDYL